MCNLISTEYVLGSILFYRPQGITVPDLNKFERKLYAYDDDLVIDISRSAIVSVMDFYDEYFKLENESIILKNYYLDNITRIKSRFVDVLDERFRDAIQTALLEE